MRKLALDAFYLGIPIFSSSSKTKDFKLLIDRLGSKLKGWRSKALSWAGRKILIQTVSQGLPFYAFSTTEVLALVCNNLDSAMRRFWWNPRKKRGHFMACKSWDLLCQQKEKGGFGFRQEKVFNQALIAKLTWWVASSKDSMCLRALWSKYKVHDDWLGKEPIKLTFPFGKRLKNWK